MDIPANFGQLDCHDQQFRNFAILSVVSFTVAGTRLHFDQLDDGMLEPDKCSIKSLMLVHEAHLWRCIHPFGVSVLFLLFCISWGQR